MQGHYNPGLVALSIAVAILASYTALDLAARVSEREAGATRARLWLVVGAFSMGCGIWSMHFIGMLAFQLPIPIAYDLPITALSLFAGIAVSAMALFILRRPQLDSGSLALGALLMGAGIIAMHYIGMAAMQMQPPIRYDPLLVTASALVAALVSLVALWIAFHLKQGLARYEILAKLSAAAIMGLAIAGMHYTGMAAAHFAPNAICLGASGRSLGADSLALIVACITLTIMVLTVFLSTFDRRMAARNARLAASLQVAKDAADAALRENERITGELRAAQSELMGAARKAGMAEIANGVLHNIGNVLNSVNVSARIIQEAMQRSSSEKLPQAMQLLNEHAADLPGFFGAHDKGPRLVNYLNGIAGALGEERHKLLAEIVRLTGSIDHVMKIVSTQQHYAGNTSVAEPLQIEAVLADALRMTTDNLREPIAIDQQVAPLPAVLLDRHLLLQILVNLLSNARHAVQAVADGSRRIRLRADAAPAEGEPRLRISVEDDGEGISPERLNRLFEHGFTTRTHGHGFGLHSSALAARAMGGTLSAYSAGAGQGARFTLELPLRTAAA